MKKKAVSFSVSLLMLAMLSLPAMAANVDLSDPNALLPVDIIIDREAGEIRKVYDLSPNTNPSFLPMDVFERDGFTYECSDILREVVIGSEAQNVLQTETVESDSKDMETILSLLPQDKEVVTEEGFEGTLHLILDSIKTEPSGYGSSTKAVTATRSYPNLASADANHLPKTITEGGRTLTLQDVQWQTDNTYNADDYEIGDRFTAVCTYGGTKTVSYVKGYTTTADYKGEVYRTGVTVIRYTVIFKGTQIEPETPEPPTEPEPAEETDSSPGVNPLILIPAALAAAVAGAGGTCFLLKNRKELVRHEEMADGGSDGADDDNDVGSGHGAGI